MTATRTIREWIGNFRWKLASGRDAVLERVFELHARLVAFAGRMAWAVETWLASTSARRAGKHDGEGFVARTKKMLSKDADSVFIKPRLIVAGVCVLLISGFLMGYAVAPRSEFRPSGLDVLPPGTWQNLSSTARPDRPPQGEVSASTSNTSTRRPVARPAAATTAAPAAPTGSPRPMESKPN